jgi:GNAT superfamily N-acetyltransferase
MEGYRAVAAGGFGANRVVLAVADDDAGRAVGCSVISLPTLENTRVVNVEIEVDPAHRRRGAGRALLAYAEEIARQEGRTTMVAGYDERLDSPAPAAGFLAAFGFEPALPELRRDLALPVDAGQLAALEAACRPYAEGYRIVTWQGGCPEELVEGRLELERVMSRDSPHGELDRELQEWDVGRLRAVEATVEGTGQLTFSAGAVAEATGLLVADTVMGVLPETPSTATQWGTTVKAEDRGHRLGMLVKIANIRAVTELSPLTTKIMTWNGETNLHMSRVNDELGFVVAARSVICQRLIG